RAAAARTATMDQVSLGRLGQQSKSEVLRAHRAWTQADSRGNSELGAHRGIDGQVSRQASRRTVIWGRVIDLFRRRRLDADLDAQLAYHLDALETELRAKGLAPDEARAAARRAMGGVTQIQDAYRD